MARTSAGDAASRGARVLKRIRADIIAGRWRPGDKLQPAELAEVYETSTTVIREALTRLAGEKFVNAENNRGFFLPHLSLDELRDITEVRCVNEGLAIRWAIERGTLEWESELTSVHHRLSRTPRRTEDDPTHTSEDWAVVHRLFHHTLIEACGVPSLLQLSGHLSDSMEVYRRWCAPLRESAGRDAEAEHRAILDAVLAHDADLAAQRLREHYERTLEIILSGGLVDGVTARKEPLIS